MINLLNVLILHILIQWAPIPVIVGPLLNAHENG